MLSFFPEMYPDELLYSVFARYHKFSGNQNVGLSYSDLLGYKRSASCNPVVMPRNLAYLSEQAQEFGVSYGELLLKRTLFPYLNLFTSDIQLMVAEARAFSLSNKGTCMSVKHRDSVDTEIEALKYCPICLEEEYKMYGESYWHRNHQIPGVLVCTKHRIVLQLSQFTPQRYIEDFCSLEKTSISSIQNGNYLNADDMKIAIQLANGIQWISDNFETAHKLWVKYINCFREVYFHLLVKKGFATKHRVILKNQFTRDIVRYYGNILSFFNFTFTNNHSYSWPTRVFLSGTREIEPIRHFLMMQYLSGSIQEFYYQLEHLKSYDFNGSSSQNYYFAAEASLFKKDKEKFRRTWKRNCKKNNSKSICCLDRKTLSARSWLYIYDYNWLINNLSTKENARDIQRLNKENEDFSSRTGMQHLPFLFSSKLFPRYGYKWDFPKAYYNRIIIKSLPETQTAFKKWKLSHWYRASKKRVLVSSEIFEYTMVSVILEKNQECVS